MTHPASCAPPLPHAPVATGPRSRIVLTHDVTPTGAEPPVHLLHPSDLTSAIAAQAPTRTTWLTLRPPHAARSAAHPLGFGPADIDALEREVAASIWPLFNGRVVREEFDRDGWLVVRDVNRRVARTLADRAAVGSVVVIDDHHLLLVPGLLRELRPDLRIALRLTIPIPGLRLLASLPWRREVVDGILGADVVAVQTEDDVEQLEAAATTLSVLRTDRHEVVCPGHRCRLIVTGMPLDVCAWNRLGDLAAADASRLRCLLRTPTVLLSVDEADGTGHMRRRMRLVGEMVANGGLLPGDSTFVQVIGRSSRRDRVQRSEIAALRADADELNRRYSAGRAPIATVVEQQLHPTDLAAWFRAADIFVATSEVRGAAPLHLQFAAARSDLHAGLVVGELAVGVDQIPTSQLVNPYDVDALQRAIARQLRASDDERAEVMSQLRAGLDRYDVHEVAGALVDALATDDEHERTTAPWWCGIATSVERRRAS